MAPILVDSKGENSIVIVGGANDLLTVEEVEKARKAIAGCSVLACQLEILPNVTLAALKIAHEEGVKILPLCSLSLSLTYFLDSYSVY